MTTLEQIESRIQQTEDSIEESKQSIHELEIAIKELDSRINQSTDATEKTELRLEKKQLNDRLNMLINKKNQLNERLNLLINAKFSKPAVSNAGELTSFISLMVLHRKLTRSSCYRRGLESIPARHGIWHETKNRIR